MHDLTPVTALAALQHGAVHRTQILDLGYPAYQLSRWQRAGRLARLSPSTFSVPGAPASWERALTAGLLELGPKALVTGRAAAALHGFDGFAPGPIEYLVPRHARRSLPGAIIHTTATLRPADRAMVNGFRCTSGVRTVFELAATATREELSKAIDSALRDGLASEAFLRRQLASLRGPGRRGVALLDDLLRDTGGHNWLERRFLTLVREARLPKPRCQVTHRRGRRVVARADFTWDAEQVVVEVAGQGRHASPQERQRDAQRQTELQLDGFIVVTFTYEDVTERPAWVMSRVREVLALRSPRSGRGSGQRTREAST